MELCYPVQIYKAPSSEEEKQRMNKNKRDRNKKRSRRQSERKFSDEIRKNIYEKRFFLYFYDFITPVFFSSHCYIRISSYIKARVLNK
jgi:hypothetical protein